MLQYNINWTNLIEATIDHPYRLSSSVYLQKEFQVGGESGLHSTVQYSSTVWHVVVSLNPQWSYSTVVRVRCTPTDVSSPIGLGARHRIRFNTTGATLKEHGMVEEKEIVDNHSN